MNATQKPQLSFEESIKGLVHHGWTVKSDGPTGVQMEGPKKMDTKDKVCAVLGAGLLLVSWPIGLLLIGCAVFDYAFLTKGEQKFFPRR
jgi:hypothetical protein